MQLTSLHKERYGEWGGNPSGNRPLPDRCAHEVYDGMTRIFSQCARKRGHGPEGAFCKQHDPDMVKARNQKSADDYREKRRREALRQSGTYIAALRKIADGHNDPRALAAETLDQFEREYPTPQTSPASR
jgi:hypothetical protein